MRRQGQHPAQPRGHSDLPSPQLLEQIASRRPYPRDQAEPLASQKPDALLVLQWNLIEDVMRNSPNHDLVYLVLALKFHLSGLPRSSHKSPRH